LFAFVSELPALKANLANMKRVTGIGGVFFKCKDPNQIKDWYKNHLGLDTDQWGTTFEWRSSEEPEKKRPGSPRPGSASTNYH